MKFFTAERIGSIMMTLNMIAALPYELGELANVLPPEWKKGVAIGSTVAYFLLRMIARGESGATAPNEGQPNIPLR